LAKTCAACVEHPAQQLFWAVTMSKSPMITLGCDVANAFAEAPPPTVPRRQFGDWWVNIMGRPPNPKGHAVPIQKALQGQLKSPRLWHQHTHNILTKDKGFERCTHKPCLHFKRDNKDQTTDDDNHKAGMRDRQWVCCCPLTSWQFCHLRQLSRGMQQSATCHQKHIANMLHGLGIVKGFNGLDIHQTRDCCLKISCELHIDKIVSHHGWEKEKATDRPIPMCNDSACQASPELASAPETENEQRKLEKAMRFSHAKPSANSHSLSLFADRILMQANNRGKWGRHNSQHVERDKSM
jgi:hypothetical protein